MRILVAFGALFLGCSSRTPAPVEEPERESMRSDGNGTPAPVDAPEAEPVPTDWVAVQISCGYAFRAPPDVVRRAIMGIDSCVSGWSASNCVHTGDYGAYSSTLTEYEEFPQYEASQESIDGRAAKVVTAVSEGVFIAAVHFPRVGRDADGARLTVWAECQDAAGQNDALRVFRTITFSR